MLRSLKALYAYTDRFLAIFSLVDASSRLNSKRLDRERQTETETDRDRDRQRQRETEIDIHTDRHTESHRRRQRYRTRKTIILRDYSRVILGPFGLDSPSLLYAAKHMHNSRTGNRPI